MLVDCKRYRTVWMNENFKVYMINQPKLPHEFEIVSFDDYRDTTKAITDMIVRGAGALGVAGGFAAAQAVKSASKGRFLRDTVERIEHVKKARPTAQNLFYSADEVLKSVLRFSSNQDPAEIALKRAQELADADSDACRLIGEYGKKLIEDGYTVATHCNAGWLAFVDWGSALSPVYAAKREGKIVKVLTDETRPRCQGARLTSWELKNEGIEHYVIADNALGHYAKAGDVDMMIVGADRIAANGDVANKIGTYEKAVVCKENGVPFYVAAPLSTFDLKCENGNNIPIEERSIDEVLYMWGINDSGERSRVRIAPVGVNAKNPAFDVTPAKYINGIITEKGIVPASKEGIESLFD